MVVLPHQEVLPVQGEEKRNLPLDFNSLDLLLNSVFNHQDPITFSFWKLPGNRLHKLPGIAVARGFSGYQTL